MTENHIVLVQRGSWQETEIQCPETNELLKGSIDDYEYCPYCGAELDHENPVPEGDV